MSGIKLYCRTCNSDLKLVGSSDLEKTFVPNYIEGAIGDDLYTSTFELDTSEWTCDCFDEDGNCLVNPDDAQDHVTVLIKNGK